ncbi:protein crumbs homolog 1-like [Centruroides sculpturatus]|uniref:protein crumbs homolog 1-like n=1 Tax=Centruroides sculpturatus TaxID=218467 RepID=UPI000C6E621C|nr:protein crumbs homolog 1-like [Centruroides sculpturatus]XP_023218697.1 protein crumbs homolog 1-like [Centruroides sculpturatus]
MICKYIFCFAAFIAILLHPANNCEENELHHGCRIRDGECFCGLGCDKKYRYETPEECHLALRGQLPDPCVKNPCKNKGICAQINERPMYQCSCAGTGYYGLHCETPCPNFHSSPELQTYYPASCIVI